jgi:hypothetical protein
MRYIIFILAVVYVFRLGIIDDVTRAFNKIVFKVPFPLGKPFSCLLCMTFWSSLVYLLITGSDVFTSVTLSLAAAFLSNTINNLISIIEKILDNLVLFIITKL